MAIRGRCSNTPLFARCVTLMALAAACAAFPASAKSDRVRAAVDSSVLPTYDITSLDCAYSVNDLTSSGTVVGLAGAQSGGKESVGLHDPFEWDGEFHYLRNYPWLSDQGQCESLSEFSEPQVSPVNNYFGANAATSAGEVVGSGLATESEDAFPYQATTWSSSASNPANVTTECGQGGGPEDDQSDIFDINDAGQAIGYITPCDASEPNLVQQPVLFDHGSLQDIGSGTEHDVGVALNS